jgi:hypothetical protein
LSNRSIAVDIVGDPHIVYGGDHLYHAWLKNGKWRREVLDGSNEVGGSAAIAIDHDGKIHIVYQDEGDQPGIKYITDRSGEWETFVVDGSEGYFSYISLAVDGGGRSMSLTSTGKARTSGMPPTAPAYGGVTP